MRKLIFQDAFEFPEAEHLVRIVDDPNDRRKIASAVTDSWGEITPIKDHTLVHIIALGAFEKTGSNLNFDAFEREVCRRSHPTFIKHASLYRHHNSKVPKAQRDGDVIKTAYNDDMDRVELLLAARHDKCADWLGKLEKGGEAKFSMGWHCDNDICSICQNKASKPDEYCDHVKKNAKAPYGRNKILPDGRKCFVFNREGYWNDISHVTRGADMIAMDLAKYAGLDDSQPIGSAELAELLEGRILSTGKLAVAQKMSDMQKRIDAVGSSVGATDRADLSESAVRELQDKTPKEMFGALAKCGAILSFKNFFKLASGSRFQDFESIVNSTVPVLRECIRRELKEASNLESISSIHDFDPSTSINIPLTQRTTSELTQFSIDPTWQEEKIKMAALTNPNECKSDVTAKGQALVRQYLAYKVALLDSVSANEEMIFNALVLN